VLRSFDDGQAQTTLFEALVDASRRYGPKKPILEDQERNPLTYTDLIRAAFALGRKIAAFTEPGERVGVMLPSSWPGSGACSPRTASSSRASCTTLSTRSRP
jgi:acyl-[acyl-carrier-protein]-phospholipid O-acyltransferase/long-chain-fatty-acid--[acyl-carrier-protein] ligase